MLRSLRLVQTRGLRPLSTANFPTYRSLAEATAEDMKLSVKQFRVVSPLEQTAIRALAIFSGLKDVNLGCQVDLYEHGLQTATRAYEDGADVEQVVVALLHDIGELLSPVAHGEVAAGLLRPYISAENYWILMHHEVFQACHKLTTMVTQPEWTKICASSSGERSILMPASIFAANGTRLLLTLISSRVHWIF